MAESWTLDPQGANYDPQSGQKNLYAQDSGLRVISVAGPVGTPPRVVRLHSGFGTRTVEWYAGKQAEPPLIPSMGNTITGDTFLAGDIQFLGPYMNTSQNSCDYRVKGSYFYVQAGAGRSASDGGNRFQTGSPAYNFSIIQGMTVVDQGQSAALSKGTPNPGKPTTVISTLRNFDFGGGPNPWQVEYLSAFFMGNVGNEVLDLSAGDYHWYYPGVVPPDFFSDTLII